MAHTSKDDYANQLVNPFFTRAQIHAFSIPPTEDVISQVNKGGKNQDYIPVEYIRTLLDRFVGPGMWEIEAPLASEKSEVIQKWEGRGQDRKQVDRVAATAILNVTLRIHARDGSGKTLTYTAVGSNTQYAGLDAGYGSIIGNAIKSAESDGVKQAAKNLGKAFGFDLKRKIRRENLPPSISQYATMLNERHAASSAPALPAPQQALPAPEAEAPVAEIRQEAAARAADGHAGQQAGARQSQEVSAERAATPPAEPARPAPKPEPAVEEQRPRPEAVAESPPAGGQAPSEDWELSMRPSRYDEWLRCLNTLTKRIAQMTSGREIENFVKRNAKLIKDLPVLPAEGDRPAKDFKTRWKKVVNARYGALGLEVPEAYRFETPDTAAA